MIRTASEADSDYGIPLRNPPQYPYVRTDGRTDDRTDVRSSNPGASRPGLPLTLRSQISHPCEACPKTVASSLPRWS